MGLLAPEALPPRMRACFPAAHGEYSICVLVRGRRLQPLLLLLQVSAGPTWPSRAQGEKAFSPPPQGPRAHEHRARGERALSHTAADTKTCMTPRKAAQQARADKPAISESKSLCTALFCHQRVAFERFPRPSSAFVMLVARPVGLRQCESKLVVVTDAAEGASDSRRALMA